MAAKSACLQGSGDPAREQAVTLPAAYKNLDLPANAYPVNGSVSLLLWIILFLVEPCLHVVSCWTTHHCSLA